MAQDIVSYDEKFAQYADRYRDEEKATGGALLSTRGGILAVDDEPLPGNQAAVIILDAVRENTYYDTKFSADTITPPRCYAFGRDDDEMAPHPSMQADEYFQPQNDSCDGCPMAEWGSSDTGRGKACSNRRRLAIIPAGFYEKVKGGDYELELFTDPAHYKAADIAYLKLPTMSVANWTKYVHHVGREVRRPPFGVITRIYLEPDPKSQFRVHFEMLDKVDEDLAEIIFQRHAEASEAIIHGYSPPREDAGRKGLRGLRGAKR